MEMDKTAFLTGILILQYVCGYYSDFSKNTKRNVILRIVIIIWIILILFGAQFYVGQQSNNYFKLVAIINLIGYGLSTFLSFIGGNTLCVFHNDLMKVEKDLKWRRIRRPAMMTGLVCLILFLEKSWCGWGYYKSIAKRINLIDTDLVGFIIWYVCKFGSLFNNFIRSVIFEWTWASMKRLRRSFNDYSFTEKNILRNLKTSYIKRIIFAYCDLLEVVNSIGFTLKIMMLWDFIFVFFYILLATTALVYSPTKELNVYMVAEALYHIIIFVYPCIIMECTRSEVDKIKLILMEIYTQSSDEKISTKAEDAIMVLEVRPFQLTVFHLITINMRLPLRFLALITSYVIVTVQFIHVYG